MTNYKGVLRDIYLSEELKIDSQYSMRLKGTIERLCTAADDKFDKCFMKVCTDLIAITKDSKKKQPCFSKMYLYLTENMHKALEELPQEYRDPILWQVVSYIAIATTNIPMQLQLVRALSCSYLAIYASIAS